jgi:senataxin
MLRQAFEEVLGADMAREVKINTVDSFQGKEMDVVIFSCVRASPSDASGTARSLLGATRVTLLT